MRNNIYRSIVLLIIGLLVLPMLFMSNNIVTTVEAQGWEPRHQDSGLVIEAAGATFPKNFYEPLIVVYEANYGITINYDATGSGTGIDRISAGITDFGGSDVFQNSQELINEGIVHIPTVMGGITPAFNLPREFRSLRFSGDTLTKIFTNQITRWNDPAIAEDNPRLRTPLPDQEIVVVVRDSGSGTTNNFTAFLEKYDSGGSGIEADKSESQWDEWFDSGRLIKANGNNGIADTIVSTPGAIGYVEISFANRPQTIRPRIENQSGIFRRGNPASVSDAASGLTFSNSNDLRTEIVDSSSRQAYPISALTYAMIHPVGPTDLRAEYDQTTAEGVADFLYFVITRGQRIASLQGYAPLPPDVEEKALDVLCNMTFDGENVGPATCP